MIKCSLPPRLFLRRATLAAGFFVAALGMNSAQAFQIVPISQEFAPTGRGSNQTFQVENSRDEQVTVTINTAVRKIDIDGKESLETTDDFTVFPTEIILQPKSSQIVRAKFTGDPSPQTELAYRIVAEETPLHMRRDAPGASVFLTVRYVGSLYVTPKSAKPDVVVASAKPVAGPSGPQLELTLENQGTQHAIFGALSLSLSGGGVTQAVDQSAIEHTLIGENILAKGQRRVLLPWPQGVPSGSVTAELKYTAE